MCCSYGFGGPFKLRIAQAALRFFVPQRALAAVEAISLRRAAVRFFARALPPFIAISRTVICFGIFFKSYLTVRLQASILRGMFVSIEIDSSRVVRPFEATAMLHVQLEDIFLREDYSDGSGGRYVLCFRTKDLVYTISESTFYRLKRLLAMAHGAAA